MVETNTQSSCNGRVVYIVDGCRTPFLKARTAPGPFSGADLAVAACKILMARQPFLPTDLGEVIAGCMMPSADEANIGRVISLRLGCGKKVPAWTVQRNCASGLQAIDNAYQDIAMGRHDLVLAGGTDAMSHAPLLYPPEMSAWMGSFMSAKTMMDKLKVLTQIRPSFFKPIISLLRGLTDHTIGLSMGQTAENLAYRFGITRTEMDAFAAQSHARVLQAQKNGNLSEVVPIYDQKGKVYDVDDGVRTDTTVEKLAKLKPFFDKKFGAVTAGNSSQVTDGAAFVILASAEAVKRYKLRVIGKVVDVAWEGVDPAQMGLGPAHAMADILKRQHLKVSDIDYWEINEAFAAQVIACVKAWESPEYCRDELGFDHALGTIPADRLNVDGGAIALGHPIGGSGARVLLHVLRILERTNTKRGMASLCIGGGQGGAMLVERVTEIA